MKRNLTPKLYEHLIEFLQLEIEDLKKQVSKLIDNKFELSDESEKQLKKIKSFVGELQAENRLLTDMHDKLCREVTRLNKRKGK